jgi:hypothetical protein
MGMTLLYGCCQIETSTPDLDATRASFEDTLGGGRIEQVLADQIDRIIPHEDYGCDHIGLGEAVFQLNQPAPGMLYNGQKSVHQSYLDRIGPCVTNLNFFIDDHVHARELLTAMGAGIHLEGPSSAASALAEYGPGNTRPGADARPFMFWGTRALIGLDLEIMEPNFLRFCEQDVQYPAFVHPRPQAGDDNLLLRRLRIVMRDLDETWTHLVRMFQPACLSRPYLHRSGPLGRAFRVWLGGIEIEYCQPRAGHGVLREELERHGPGCIAIDFSARDLDAALARCAGRAAVGAEPDWLGTGAQGRLIASRARTGFDTVLEMGTITPASQ